jgi:hypothetical protein
MKKTGKNLAEFKKEFSPDADVVHLRKRVADLEARIADEKDSRGELMESLHGLDVAVASSVPPKLIYTPSTKTGSPITHVLHLTDWHYGSIIKKDEVDGFGEFSPQIAQDRVMDLANRIIRFTDVIRHGYAIPKLHIIATADMISGGIHQELLVTNAFPEPIQSVECGYLFGAMLELFAPHFPEIVVDFVTLDNHGRLTKKPQAAEGGLNNWCYVVAEIGKHYVSKLGNIVFNVHAKPSALIKEGPEQYLAFHGHQIKGWGGIPYYGLDRRVAMEAVKRMGLPEVAFTKLVSGHLHHAMNGMTWNLGGSLSGTDAFDHSCGRHAPPHQTSWLVHPEHGEFAFNRWWL